MGHDKLENYFKTNFALMHYHKWSLTEVESMIPWEKSIYVILLQNHLKDEEIRQKELELERINQKNAMNSLARRR